MGILTPDEMANIKADPKRVILALIDTAKRTTDLETVYNDETGESFSWDEVYESLGVDKNS